MKICPACVGDNAGSGNEFSVRREKKALAAAIRTTWFVSRPQRAWTLGAFVYEAIQRDRDPPTL